MTTEEPLSSRWKVIADYPKSVFNVGDILINNSIYPQEYISWEDYGKDVYCPNDFPDIFQKLEWWEERSIEDMPEYVKHIGSEDGDAPFEINTIHKVVWDRVELCSITPYNDNLGHWNYLNVYEVKPATEEEYLNQTK